ncbi:uncharacterized protein LOC114523724 isoform X2 [Dendronephthya gigantea]|uniref:uncharacterized protein LOC114523724 isoform X2 n=1 Tax=Dendronephthya gigantea TaxID=151771 RepID=UPI00106DA913|nr:uncharacterized protein LOC114523724 isoform X2 [Dendronephthya gigantea]
MQILWMIHDSLISKLNMADKPAHERFEEIGEKASNDEKSLPFTEKLHLLDKEIRLLREFCLKVGLNDKEIECCAEPLLKEQRAEDHKKWWTKVFYVSFFLAIVAFLLWYEPTYRYICIFGKLASMKLLPYWDWTTEFEKDCFVENPYYVDEFLTEDDCEVCTAISGTRLKNVSQDLMAENYLFNAIPVVVTDATKDWPIDVQSFDLNKLKEVYLDNKLSDPAKYCTFEAFDANIDSARQLFSVLQDNNLDHWQGYWENCEPATAKSIRKFYRRPYFLPPMAEAAAENWVFAAYDSEGNEAGMKWEHIKGQSQIVLKPKSPCDAICKKMSATLKPGETIVFVNRLWEFKRRPRATEMSISVAATVSWDKI